jgi:hypothetical protein
MYVGYYSKARPMIPFVTSIRLDGGANWQRFMGKAKSAWSGIMGVDAC